MSKIKINKRDFIDAMESIKQQFRHDEKCSKAFSVILPNDYISSYDNTSIVNGFIDLLKILMNDDESWIDYYIYELDFGDRYKNGDVVSEYGEEIQLKTFNDLYAFLVKNNG
ncbi:MAG: hypothetical protein ACOC2W_04570 [bacterium]